MSFCNINLLFIEDKVVVVKEPSTIQDGCSSDSFMLNDGVCDELTNHQRCIFDGGDCCHQNKSTELCSVCTCKLHVVDKELNDDYASLDIKIYQDVNAFAQKKMMTVAAIEDVESFKVCSRICMDVDRYSLANDWKILADERTIDWRRNVNAWTFHIENRICTCLTLLTAPFCPPSHNHGLIPAQDFVPRNFHMGITFVQMSKLPDCGKSSYFMLFILLF